MAFLSSRVGLKSQNIVVTHPTAPYFLSPLFKTFATHPPKINEFDTVVTPTLTTPKIWNVHSVNSNWAHCSPGQPSAKMFFDRANPGHPGIFCLISCPEEK